jgi:hypothetical protein
MISKLDNRRMTVSSYLQLFRSSRVLGLVAALLPFFLLGLLLDKPAGRARAAQQPPQVMISGVIVDNQGQPMADVQIAVEGSRRAGTLTGPNGAYQVAVPQGGSYIVTPYFQGAAFNPGSLRFDSLNNSQPGVNFVGTRMGTFKVTGKVVDSSGRALGDVVIRLDITPQIVTITGPTGDFNFNFLTAGAAYTLVPVRNGYTFDPPAFTINNLNRNVSGISFVAVPSQKVRISGMVTDGFGGALPDVIIGMTGPGTPLSTTGPGGFYSFVVESGGSYTVAPARDGYSFNPPSQTLSNLTTNQSAVNFVGTRVPMVRISGLVMDGSGMPMSDVPVAINGATNGTAPTGPAGNYQFNVLATGSYTVAPVVPGIAFLPPSRSFTNLTNDQFEANFVAIANPTGVTQRPGEVTPLINLPSPSPEASPSPSPSPSPTASPTPTPKSKASPEKPTPEPSPKTEEKPSTPPGPAKPGVEEKATPVSGSANSRRRRGRRRSVRRPARSRRGAPGKRTSTTSRRATKPKGRAPAKR